jgi:hypothetical protein
MITSHLKSTFALLIASLLLASCTVGLNTNNGAASTAVYQANTLVTTVDASMDTTFRATISSLDALNDYFRTGEVVKETSVAIIARKVGDVRVHIKLIKVSEEQTEIRVRIGLIGDLPESQLILNTIQEQLS